MTAPTSSGAAQGTFGTTVVPIDFGSSRPRTSEVLSVGNDAAFEISEITVRAVQLADRLTKGGTVHLVHATPELTHFGLAGAEGAWFPHDSAAQLNRVAKEHAMSVLEQLARACRESRVAYDVRSGRASDVILRVVDAVEADAVVLPLSGHGRVRRALLGSTADKVIRQASCPVLIVPARED